MISSVFATQNTLDLLNSEIIKILAPFPNHTTRAHLKFDAVKIDDKHATKLSLHELSSKIGSQNKLKIIIDNLSYDYHDGQSPTTVVKGEVGIDLTKLLTQEQSNEIIPQAIELLEETVKSQTAPAKQVA